MVSSYKNAPWHLSGTAFRRGLSPPMGSTHTGCPGSIRMQGGGRRFSTDQDPGAIIINKEHLVPQVLPLFDSLAIPFFLVCGFLLSASFPWPFVCIFSMAPVFFFPRQRPLPLPFFAFPYHSNLKVLLQGRSLACPGTGRAVSFASGVFRAAAGGQEKFPKLEKVITDAIAFPPPMTHNGVGFRVIRGRPPAKPPQDTGFCPQGGSQGDSIMAHRNGRQ